MLSLKYRPLSGRRLFSQIAWVIAGMCLTSPVTAYESAAVSNGGVIQGKVTYSATVPNRKIIPSDPAICGNPRDIPLIETTDAGGVTDAVVYLQDVKSGKAWPEQTTTPTLDNKGCRFEPQLVVMPPGPISIVNSDEILHNTHSFYGRRTAFNIALPKQGVQVERELTRPGILRVECDEHGHMSARIFVAENPYYAATSDGGTFTIDGVPPGEYKLIVYQEKTGEVEQMITVAAGATAELDIDLAKGQITQR